MARIYRLSRKGLHLIQKVRRHRGHGVHSPFVFNLINNVIEEKAAYYAYEDIAKYLLPFDANVYRVNKSHTLAFRMVNRFNPRRILEIGAGNGLNTLYLTAVSSQAICHSIEADPVNFNYAKELYGAGWGRKIELSDNLQQNFTGKYSCIYINLNNFNDLSDERIQTIEELVDEKSFIIVEGIRTNRKQRLLWNSIKDLKSRTAVLDLFDIGVVFFNTELYRWDHKISF